MKLKLKLPLAFGAILLLMLLAGLGGIYALNGALHRFNTEVSQALERERTAREIDSQFKTQVQEWKNTLLRGSDAKQRERYWTAFGKNEAEVAARTGELVRALPDGKARELARQFLAAHQKMAQSYVAGFKAFEAAQFDPAVGDKAVQGVDRDPSRLVRELADQISDDAHAMESEATRQGERATWISLVLMGGLAAMGMGLAVLISRAVVRPITEAVSVANRVASGDLSVPVHAQGSDEVAEMMRALSTMSVSLVRVIGHVRSSIESIGTASAQIASGNQDLSQRTEQAASNLEETAASMEEITSTVRQSADAATQAQSVVVSASGSAQQGGEVMSRMVHTMGEINEASRRIADIIGVIDSIAFQTNILALNAAVEAARAGEQGRGFAVVASEVRSLAGRSAEAAKEIKRLIGDSVGKVDDGGRLVQDAGVAMDNIVRNVASVQTIIGEITNAARDQADGIDQVNVAVSQLDQMTQQNAALVEESAAAAESLKHQAASLAQAISVFKLAPHAGAA
ncbi:methyl-accepting chemotaxis protein [Hydrogenophaga sp. OTU3427]|uniref:methyl-accepting chemotaxis protein n=1 Tax=Hydrogenophaga sp. OTU3427 TaxID=3043856 RepID=UPI00313CAB59